ncbi:MAG: ATP-binding protein, partial [Candidatus Heimdallarchaeota archaeon]|nr:ATP-binding protein [Candidatus Heimdallarchaeota archaeon]
RKSTLVDIELFGEKIDEKYDFENERNTIPFLTIQITDTGAGIPEHIGDRIFESFYSTKEKGTGLGLAVVKSIIDNFKGYITYKSKQNFGTSFYILLPLITT